MIWHRRSLELDPALGEFLEERLLVGGFERISSERPTGSPHLILSVYAEDPAELPGPEALARWLAEAEDAGLSASEHRWTEDSLAERDWDAAFRAHFGRRRLTERLEIVPSWERGETSRRDVPGPGAPLSIVLDPGQAFGTGDHPTTAACLRRLERWMQERHGAAPRCLDVGSGTGILSLAARLWGAGEVVGYDIDAASIVNSYLNADLNGLSGELEFRWSEPTALGESSRDLILCNLFMGPILRLLPRLDIALAAGGSAILSGFLAPQAARIREAAEARGWILTAEENHEDWVVQEWSKPPA